MYFLVVVGRQGTKKPGHMLNMDPVQTGHKQKIVLLLQINSSLFKYH